MESAEGADSQKQDLSQLVGAAMADSSHVRFASSHVEQVHDAEIVVQYVEPHRLQVHLGFLQIFHVYEITFTVKDPLGEDLQADPLQNLHVKLCEARPTEDGEGHVLKLQLYAHHEKLMRETLVLSDCQSPSSTLTLQLNARVLGKGKGKPSLLNGIHCTGVNHDEDSENSDWQGFD